MSMANIMVGVEEVIHSWAQEMENGKPPEEVLARSSLAKKKKERLYAMVRVWMSKKGIRIPNNPDLIKKVLYQYLVEKKDTT